MFFLKKIFNKLGPGFITGAADDDPSGIATYTQTGAQFGYGQLWTALFMFPFMVAVQEACARIGAVTGRGIASNIKKYYSKPVLYFVVGLVLFANIINIGADIGAMAAAAQLLIPIPFVALTLIFTTSILLLEIFTTYKTYSHILKWFGLSLLAYVIAVFVVSQPWGNVIKSTLIPHFELNFAFVFIITGVFGTTITPYMFFWQASEEIEEEKAKHIFNDGHPKIKLNFLKSIRLDTLLGMGFSNIVTWSIIATAATVLHQNGLTDIQTTADAAKALEPLVGSFPHAGTIAKSLYALGIIGVGFMAVPVLSGSAAYAISEVFGWREGLNLKLKRAPEFYSVIIAATICGLLINFLGVDPIKALIYTAVFNGLAAIPLIFFIARISSSQKIMGRFKSGLLSQSLLWLTFIIMALTGLSLVFLG